MLMALDTPLEGGGEGSKRKCWDFTGQKYVPMAKQGHVWMCFTDPNADSTDHGLFGTYTSIQELHGYAMNSGGVRITV